MRYEDEYTQDDFSKKYNTWHKNASYVKSFMRIFGCALAISMNSLFVLCIVLILAEVIGIAEEWI